MSRENLPAHDGVSRRFFDRLAEGLLSTTRCTTCGVLAYPPRAWCHGCLSEDLAWVELSGRGTLVAFSTQERGARFAAPHVIGLVDLDEGVRVLSVIVGAYEDLRIGQPVKAELFEAEPGLVLHRFAPTG